MQILPATGGVAATNCYLVADEKTGDCIIIDAPDHTVAPLLDEIDARKWKLAALWLTHGHFDHLADHQAVKNRFPQRQDRHPRTRRPQAPPPRQRDVPPALRDPPGEPDVIIQDNDAGTFGSLTGQALFTPGTARPRLLLL